MGSGIIIALVVFAVIAFVIITYNRLITLRNRTLNSFSQIEVQLKRRYELIPNLVETAKAYMEHESSSLIAVTEARNQAAERCEKAAKHPEESSLISALASAENTLSGAMGRLNVVMENYPDLKADAQMRDLSDELASTENRVAYARQAYSDSVMQYNTASEQFPAVIIASLFSFKQADLFEVDQPDMKEAVSVSFA